MAATPLRAHQPHPWRNIALTVLLFATLGVALEVVALTTIESHLLAPHDRKHTCPSLHAQGRVRPPWQSTEQPVAVTFQESLRQEGGCSESRFLLPVTKRTEAALAGRTPLRI